MGHDGMTDRWVQYVLMGGWWVPYLVPSQIIIT